MRSSRTAGGFYPRRVLLVYRRRPIFGISTRSIRPYIDRHVIHAGITINFAKSAVSSAAFTVVSRNHHGNSASRLTGVTVSRKRGLSFVRRGGQRANGTTNFIGDSSEEPEIFPRELDEGRYGDAFARCFNFCESLGETLCIGALIHFYFRNNKIIIK